MYFEWKDTYSVNIDEIDKQHRNLFEIGGKISDLVLAKDEFDHYDEIMAILQDMEEYTLYHFKYEEEMMDKLGFKDSDSHKIEHSFMIKKLQKIKNKDIDTHQKIITVDLISFISDWISGHILKTDMQYKAFFNEKGVK